jgi:Ras-related protein Rab-18
MRQVSTAEGTEFAAKMGCLFVESSAKTAVGVREAFRDVIEHILHRDIPDSESQLSGSPGPIKATLRKATTFY